MNTRDLDRYVERLDANVRWPSRVELARHLHRAHVERNRAFRQVWHHVGDLYRHLFQRIAQPSRRPIQRCHGNFAHGAT